MISEIIQYLNTKLSLLGYFEKQYELCEILQKEDKRAPYAYCGNGEWKHCSDFDSYSGVMYWRMNGSNSYSDISNISLVACQRLTQMEIPLRLVVCVPRKKLPTDTIYSAERLANTVKQTITENNNSLKLALRAMKITFDISSMDSEPNSVNSAEHSGRDVNYEFLYLALNVNVTIDIPDSCIVADCDYIYTDRCTVLNAMVTPTERRQCILPEFDFTDDDDFDALSDQQETDLTIRLCGGGGNVTIQVNGAPWGVFGAPSTQNIPVVNTEATALGSKVGPNWLIPDSIYNVYINGTLNQTINLPTLKNETINIYP